MARTTNSDTLPFVESRYELGMLASQRVRDLNGGAEPVVEKKNDKLTVVALREIATGKLDMGEIRHEFVQSYKDAPTTQNSEEALEAVEDSKTAEIASELMTEATGGMAEFDAVLDGGMDVITEENIDEVEQQYGDVA